MIKKFFAWFKIPEKLKSTKLQGAIMLFLVSTFALLSEGVGFTTVALATFGEWSSFNLILYAAYSGSNLTQDHIFLKNKQHEVQLNGYQNLGHESSELDLPYIVDMEVGEDSDGCSCGNPDCQCGDI